MLKTILLAPLYCFVATWLPSKVKTTIGIPIWTKNFNPTAVKKTWFCCRGFCYQQIQKKWYNWMFFSLSTGRLHPVFFFFLFLFASFEIENPFFQVVSMVSLWIVTHANSAALAKLLTGKKRRRQNLQIIHHQLHVTVRCHYKNALNGLLILWLIQTCRFFSWLLKKGS